MISIYMTNAIVVLVNSLIFYLGIFANILKLLLFSKKNSFEFSHLLIIMYLDYLCNYYFQLVIVFSFLQTTVIAYILY